MFKSIKERSFFRYFIVFCIISLLPLYAYPVLHVGAWFKATREFLEMNFIHFRKFKHDTCIFHILLFCATKRYVTFMVFWPTWPTPNFINKVFFNTCCHIVFFWLHAWTRFSVQKSMFHGLILYSDLTKMFL